MLNRDRHGRFEGEIARAVVLALFVPLIISSGGNSGRRLRARRGAPRATAAAAPRLVARRAREVSAGLVLGTVLAAIGFARILLWQGLFTVREHYLLVRAHGLVELNLASSPGELAGSMLPWLSAPRLRPGERVGALRRDARRRERHRHLLSRWRASFSADLLVADSDFHGTPCSAGDEHLAHVG